MVEPFADIGRGVLALLLTASVCASSASAGRVQGVVGGWSPGVAAGSVEVGLDGTMRRAHKDRPPRPASKRISRTHRRPHARDYLRQNCFPVDTPGYLGWVCPEPWRAP